MVAQRPAYGLDEVKRLVACGAFAITRSAAAGASALYLDESDIVECVASLEERDFYKSMPSHWDSALFQDVYKRPFQGFRLYVKVQISAGGRAVVVSFKRDESA